MVITVHEPSLGTVGFGASQMAPKVKAYKKPSSFEGAKRLASKERIPDFCIAQLDGLKRAHRRQKRARSIQQQEESQLSLQNALGYMGFSFFPCSVDMDEFIRDSQDHEEHSEIKNNSLLDSLADDMDDMDLDVPEVHVKPEPLSDLQSCPRLLTPEMMKQLLKEALPVSLSTARWDRIHALGRDGDAFCTMIQHCRNYKDTIVVVQNSQGHLLGGYASSPWAPQGKTFYGTGVSFLFCSHLQNSEDEPLSIFKWTGRNTYCQVCDADSGILAMGGEGAFGLFIGDNFSRGSTGYCSTYANPPLVPGGQFDVVGFEVYGFTSLGGATM